MTWILSSTQLLLCISLMLYEQARDLEESFNFLIHFSFLRSSFFFISFLFSWLFYSSLLLSIFWWIEPTVVSHSYQIVFKTGQIIGLPNRYPFSLLRSISQIFLIKVLVKPVSSLYEMGRGKALSNLLLETFTIHQTPEQKAFAVCPPQSIINSIRTVV